MATRKGNKRGPAKNRRRGGPTPQRPMYIMSGSPPKKRAPTRRKNKKSKPRAKCVAKVTGGTLLGGALGAGGTYGIARTLDTEKKRVIGNGALSAVALAATVVAAVTDSPLISHAAAAVHGAGLGAIGNEIGARHRKEAAAKTGAVGGTVTDEDLQTEGPGITMLFKMLASRLLGEGATAPEIGAYTGDVGLRIDRGHIPNKVVVDAYRLLEADDLASAVATLEGVSYDEVDTAGPLRFIKKKFQKAKTKIKDNRDDRKDKRDDRKAEKTADKAIKTAVNEQNNPFKFSMDNALSNRLDAVLRS